MPVRAESSDHVHLRGQVLRGDGVGLASLPPLLVPKVEVRQPRLVDVDDALALLEELEHLLGVEHAHDQTALGVALVRYLLESTVPHVEVVTQDSFDFVELDVDGGLRLE